MTFLGCSIFALVILAGKELEEEQKTAKQLWYIRNA